MTPNTHEDWIIRYQRQLAAQLRSFWGVAYWSQGIPHDGGNIKILHPQEVYVDLRLTRARPASQLAGYGPPPLPAYKPKDFDDETRELRMSVLGIDDARAAIADIALLQSLPFVLILGGAGSGKSTLVRHLALELLDSDRHACERLPIYVQLGREHGPIADLPGLLQAHIDATLRQAKAPCAPPEALKSLLAQGKIAAFLDGLDELCDETTRSGLLGALADWMGNTGSPVNPIWITSRPGLDAALDCLPRAFETRYMAPLNSEASAHLLRRWYAFNAPDHLPSVRDGVQADEQTRAWVAGRIDGLLTQIDGQPTLSQEARTPLLLQIVAATSTQQRNTLPSRGLLYQEFLRRVLSNHFSSKTDLDLAERILEELAWTLHSSDNPVDTAQGLKVIHEAGRYGSLASDMLNLLAAEGGVLTQASGRIVFCHQAFQEFYVARRLYTNWLGSPRGGLPSITEYGDKPRWQEPILLFLGLLDKERAWPLVSKALAENPAWGVRCVCEGVGDLPWSYRQEAARKLLKQADALLADNGRPWRNILDRIMRRDPEEVGTACWTACQAMGDLQLADTIKPLTVFAVHFLSIVSDHYHPVLRELAHILGRMRPADIVPPMIEMTSGGSRLAGLPKDAQKAAKEWALWVIRSLRGADAISQLGELACHKNDDVRWAALGGLSAIAQESADDTHTIAQIKAAVQPAAEGGASPNELYSVLEELCAASPAYTPDLARAVVLRWLPAFLSGQGNRHQLWMLVNLLCMLPVEEGAAMLQKLLDLPGAEPDPQGMIGGSRENFYARGRLRMLLRLAVSPNPSTRRSALPQLDAVYQSAIRDLPAEDEDLVLAVLDNTSADEDNGILRSRSSLVKLLPGTTGFCRSMAERLQRADRSRLILYLWAAAGLRRASLPDRLAVALPIVQLMRRERGWSAAVEALSGLGVPATLFAAWQAIDVPFELDCNVEGLFGLLEQLDADDYRQLLAGRPAALREIGEMQTTPGGPVRWRSLIKSLQPGVARAAVHALGEHGDPGDVAEIVAWLDQRLATSHDSSESALDLAAAGGAASQLMREEIIHSLAQQGPVAGSEGLACYGLLAAMLLGFGEAGLRALTRLRKGGLERNDARPLAIAIALAARSEQLPADIAAHALVDWYMAYGERVGHADLFLIAHALRWLKPASVRMTVLPLLTGQDVHGRRLALYTLGELRDEVDVPHLIPWLSELPDEAALEHGAPAWEAVFAAAALGKIGLATICARAGTGVLDTPLREALARATRASDPAYALFELAAAERDLMLQFELAMLLGGIEQGRQVSYLELLAAIASPAIGLAVKSWHAYADDESYYWGYQGHHLPFAKRVLSELERTRD